MQMRKYLRLGGWIFLALVPLWACGGGGSSGSSGANTTAIQGSIFAAPVSGASVWAKDTGGNIVAGPVTTASGGTFTIHVPTSSLASDLRIESRGGSFSDEASGAPTTAGLLGAYVPAAALSADSAVNLDPSSTIIYHLTNKYGKSVSEARAVFNAAFGYAPDISVAPTNAPSSGADKSRSLAGLRAITFSQLTKDLGLSPDKQFDLLSAIAQDLADGFLDGKEGALRVSLGSGVNMPEDIQNGFERALCGLLANTGVNRTGVTADQIGPLPFSKVALTNTYRVEYVPESTGATEGKTTFRLKITRRDNASPTTGLVVSLTPKMFMASMSHASPVDTVIEDNNTPGTYLCTVYYLMACKAASGMMMGYWELKAAIGSPAETVTFYPFVDRAAASNTIRATLKGQYDVIAAMSAPEKRSYYLFHDGVTRSTFNLFIAAKESMMSYPAVSIGTTLHDATGMPWTVNPMSVSASTDGTTWVSAADVAGGHWFFGGLTGLATGQAGTIRVRVTINSEQKTTDGNAGSGTNEYATFTVTP